MKKWAVLTFAVALIAAVLTGCGSVAEISPEIVKHNGFQSRARG